MTDDIAQIDLYVRGLLQGESLEEFKNRLAIDETLRREVALHRSIMQNAIAAGRAELRSQLKQYHQEISPSESLSVSATGDPESGQKRKTISRRRIWLAAAAVAVIFAFAGLYYYASISSERLFYSQFSPYVVRTYRGSPSQEMIALYNAAQYEAYLSRYEGNEPQSLQTEFLAGNAYLSLGKMTEAIAVFQDLITRNEGVPIKDRQYHEDAEYYLALAYLKNNQVQEAERLFDKIAASPQHAYAHLVTAGFLWKLQLLEFKNH